MNSAFFSPKLTRQLFERKIGVEMEIFGKKRSKKNKELVMDLLHWSCRDLSRNLIKLSEIGSGMLVFFCGNLTLQLFEFSRFNFWGVTDVEMK